MNFMTSWRLFFLAVCCTSLAGCSGIFFQPDHAVRWTPTKLGLSHEVVNFTSTDGTPLHGWLLPATGTAKGVVLFLHGNAENISTHIASVFWLPAQGYSVFLFDYRGYGNSQGKPNVAGALADTEAALGWLAARSDMRTLPIIIFGQSLGGALAVPAAARSQYRERIRALVIESAFSSYRNIAREKLASFWVTWPMQWPLSFLFSDAASPIDHIPHIAPIPLLIIHGARDQVVPDRHAQRLYAAAQQPKELWLEPRGRHIEVTAFPEYRTRLTAWLDEQVGSVIR